jgi:hypothetical protein
MKIAFSDVNQSGLHRFRPVSHHTEGPFEFPSRRFPCPFLKMKNHPDEAHKITTAYRFSFCIKIEDSPD